MEQNTNAEYKEQEREQLVQLGSDITKGKDGRIYTLTIIGRSKAIRFCRKIAKQRNTSMSCHFWPA